MSLTKGFRLYQKLEPRFSIILECRTKDEMLMFESNAVAVLSASEAETLKKFYTKVLDVYGCLGVLNLTTGDEPSLYLVLVTACIAIGKIGDSDIYRITGTTFQSLQGPALDEERLVELRKLLNGGTFYFSWPLKDAKFCLSVCAQRFNSNQTVDVRFFWNRSLHFHLWCFGIECSDWLVKVICGGVEIRTIYASQRQAKACLISRYSCERAGTRFNVRGVNDDGHVASFVETEQLIWIEDEVCSFVQTRGSVPLFWEQPGFQVGTPKVKMHRGHEASAPAFDRHFTLQKILYGDIVVVNLLGRNEGEHMLNQAFQSHHKASACCRDVPMVTFDYHAECRNVKSLGSVQKTIRKHMDDFGFFYCSGSDIKKTQTGTIRTNCFDCLDRTNAMQSILGLEFLVEQLNCLGLASKAQMKARFEEVYKQMWTVNADHISRIYAGTGALGKSKATDAARSAGRAIQNNFLDSAKQDAIDMLLFGSAMKMELSYKTMSLLDAPCMPGSREIMKSMIVRAPDFATTSNIRVSVGTWNVNGGKFFRSVAFKHELITDWLLDLPKITVQNKPEMVEPDVDFSIPIDIFAIGFQEIVDLNASNIVSASTQNQKDWGIYLQKNLSREHKYIQLTSAQLVGVCLYVFVRPKHAPHIKRSLFTTQFGPYTEGPSNETERQPTVDQQFEKGRKLWHHDYVFWFGDFNYRIDMTHEEVKDLIHLEKWTTMQMADQLNVHRQTGQVFQGFNEGPTNFAPTYKYDLFCEDYDTSEKCRVPAWTDRILWRKNPGGAHALDSGNYSFGDITEEEKANQGKLLLYNRAELKSSDHRPVMAVFELEVVCCDVDRRNSTFRQVIDCLGPPDGTVQVELVDSQLQFSDNMIEEIVRVFSEIGEIVLVRFQGSCMTLTYSSGREALEALHLDQKVVDGQMIRVSLRTSNWQHLLEEEMNLTRNSGHLNQSGDATANSLLDDDITVPALAFEVSADEEAEDDGGSSASTSRRSSEGQIIQVSASSSVTPHVIDSSASSTIEGSLNLSDKEVRGQYQDEVSRGESNITKAKAGVLSEVRSHNEINKDQPEVAKGHHDVSRGQSEVCGTKSDDLSTTASMEQPQIVSVHQSEKNPVKTCPPPRPAALPARPPPPSRPLVPPSAAKAEVTGESLVVVEQSTLVQAQPPDSACGKKQNLPSVPRQPMRPQMGPRHERPAQVKMINHISTPTNVSHTVHATTIEEAQLLIRKLMQGRSTSAGGQTKVSITDEKQLAAPVAAQRIHSQEFAHPKPLPRPKSEYKLSSATEPKPVYVQRNRSIGSADSRSTRPPPPAAPSSHPTDASASTSTQRSCPPTAAPRRDVKGSRVRNPEVSHQPTMAAPVRTRRSLHCVTEQQSGAVSSTDDTSQRLDQRRRSSSEFGVNLVAPYKGEMKAVPVVGVATMMASQKPPSSASVPPSAANQPTLLSRSSDVAPQEKL